MSSPPTVTKDNTFAVSTLTGNAWSAPSILPSNPLIVPFAGKPDPRPDAAYAWQSETATWLSGAGGAWNDGHYTGGNGWGFRFRTDAPSFDVSVQHTASYSSLRLKVNGQWSPLLSLAPQGGGWGYAKYAFGSTSMRDLELHCSALANVVGFNLTPGYSLSAVPVLATRGLMLGDSFTVGHEVNDLSATLPKALAAYLGIVDLIPSGINGQGWSKTDPTSAFTFINRIDAGDLTRAGVPDIAFLPGSVNDLGKTQAEQTAAMVLGYQKARAALPSAFLVIPSLFHTTSNDSVFSARNTAIVNALTPVIDSHTLLIDTAASGFPTIGAVDGVHPDAAECAEVARLIMLLVAPWLGRFATDDLIVNGTFDVGLNGWIDASVAPSSMGWSAGQAVTVVSGGALSILRQPIPTVNGGVYRITVNSAAGWRVGSTPGGIDLLGAAVGASRDFTATGPLSWLDFATATNGRTVDDVTCRRIA